MSPDDRDELLPDGVPSFDDPAYDDLRDLLADARVTDPIPREVENRIDDVIAGLSAERSGKVAPTRRSRIGQRLLIAAATVIVVGAGGVGISQVMDGGLSGGSDDKSASADSTGGGSTAAQPESAPGSSPVTGSGANVDRASAYALPRLRTSDFATGSKRLTTSSRDSMLSTLSDSYTALNGTTDSRGDFTPMAPVPTSSDLDETHSTAKQAPRSCALPDVLDSTIYAIYLDGKRATLVVHPVTGGKQLVQAWSCDAKTILTSTEISR